MSQITHYGTNRDAHSAKPTKIPLPAGAVRISDWDLGLTGADGMPSVYRGFSGTPRLVDCDDRDRDIEVEVGGIQHMDGRIEHEIYVSEIDGALTPATARPLGAALIAAADEYERLT
jgi:hypothetical protein